MKKTIISMAAAALCASALSTQAFATDITEDMSIFAENPEELVATIKGWPDEGTFLDPKTIMLEYQANINDYINTGKLKISDVDQNGYRYYISDLVDSNGTFLGVVQSVEIDEGKPEASQFFPEYGEDPLTYEKSKQCSSVDFRLYSEEIKSLLLANGISPDVKEVKLLSLEGVGIIYYINNGTDEVLVNMRGLDLGPQEGYFDGTELIVLNEEFRQKAARIEEENREAYDKFIEENGEDAKGAGGAGGTGTGSESDKNDNPNTGADESAKTTKRMAVLTVELSALAAAGIGITVINKKRKKKN